MSNATLIELRNIRLEKVEKLRELGINPYPAKSSRTHYAGAIIDSFEQLESSEVTVAGRLMSWRPHGKLTFAHIQDQSGRIQLALEKQSLESADPDRGCLSYSQFKLLDIGDFVESTGTVMKTKRGEISVKADNIRLLTKSLRPLPEKWHGLRDREAILRQRYLYTTLTPSEKVQFETTSKMVFAIRAFLDKEGFVEFHTPVIQPQYGGGTAKPFTTYVNALHSKMYLAISHELYLKRLIAGGFDKVYTIGRYFRNEGIDKDHHPEFSMLETMTAYENYEYNMDLLERIFRHVASEVFGKTVFNVMGHQVDLGKPWNRISMRDAVKKITGVDFGACKSVAQANQHLESLGISEPQSSVGRALATAFDERVCDKLIEPTIVYGHPVDVSPLAKAMDDNPDCAERFEVIIGGMECSDNWSEQNDPQVLLERWTEALRRVGGAADESHPIDYDFIEVLEYGMPPTTGIGPGIERMAMIFNEKDNIDDVIYFTMMRPVPSAANAAIFGLRQSPAAAQHSGEDLCISLDEFQTLLAEGVLRPHDSEVVVQPNLRLWRPAEGRGKYRAAGYLEVDGFGKDTRLMLSAYTAKSEKPLDADTEAKSFADAVEKGFVAKVREHCPGCRLTVEPVACVGP